MNLYVYDLGDEDNASSSRTFTRLRHQVPSLGDKAIVFENGGWIYRFDLATRKGREDSDPHPRGSRRRPRRADEREQERHAVTRFRPTASGPCSTARGDIFTVPAKDGADAQPDQHLRRPRAQCRMVARRQERSPSSPTPPARTRSGPIAPTAAAQPTQLTNGGDTYKYELALVARQQEDPLGATRNCGCNTSMSARSRSRRSTQGEGVGDPRFRLVARSQVDRLRQAGTEEAWPNV